MSLTVSVDVKQHWTMLGHWSQFVPNISTDVQGHEALHHHHQFKAHAQEPVFESLRFDFFSDSVQVTVTTLNIQWPPWQDNGSGSINCWVSLKMNGIGHFWFVSFCSVLSMLLYLCVFFLVHETCSLAIVCLCVFYSLGLFSLLLLLPYLCNCPMPCKCVPNM